MSLYKDIILDHYRSPRNYGRLGGHKKTVIVENPLCGDRIVLDLILEKGRVKNIKFSGQGCVISRASASMLYSYAKGKHKKTLQKLDKDFIIKMLGIDLSPNRIKCAILALEGLQQSLVSESED